MAVITPNYTATDTATAELVGKQYPMAIFGSGGTWTTGNVANANLWIGTEAGSVFTDHEAAPANNGNRWLRLNPDYAYKLTAFVSRNDSQAHQGGYRWAIGGVYGSTNHIGSQGSAKPRIVSGTSYASVIQNMPAIAIVSGETFVSVVRTSTGSITSYGGNDSYAGSHIIVECLGKVTA